jgi:hypothetical protein
MAGYSSTRKLKPGTESASEDTSWMPPQDEWDFRSVSDNECRFVCLWEYFREYFRSIHKIDLTDTSQIVRWFRSDKEQKANRAKLRTAYYLCAKAGYLSKPYLTIRSIVYKQISPTDFKDLPAFVTDLKPHRKRSAVSGFIWENLSQGIQKKLLRCGKGLLPHRSVQSSLVAEVNQMLSKTEFYNAERFKSVQLDGLTDLEQQPMRREEFRTLSNAFPKSRTEIFWLNRRLLEEAYPDKIRRNRDLLPLDWRAFNYHGRATLLEPLPGIRKRMKKMISDADDPAEVVERFLGKKHYVLSVNFALGGKEKVKDELCSWVDDEAGKQPQKPRGKASALPYAYLKWLAVHRLEQARQKADLSFEEVQLRLNEYWGKSPMTNAPEVLPVYKEHAAWSKAKSAAISHLEKINSYPETFEREILL